MRFLISLSFLLNFCYAQVVKGRITDAVDGKFLQDASVVLQNEDTVFQNTTDSAGFFLIEAIPPGRYMLKAQYTGYSAYTIEVLVSSGKQHSFQIPMSPEATLLSGVEITSPRDIAHQPNAYILGIEKTMRIPANFFDPVRMATSYPGVVAANDQANSIIVKGNSPNGLSWRLNEVDILNPNHLANAGTFSDKPAANGGGVNILSAQMLDYTSLYTGAFSAPYGNVLSGVLDMRLRDGDDRAWQYTAQASLIGIDLSAEGPLKKNKSAVLANYRYSTVGLLSELGVSFGDEQISFQDFSLNLVFKNEAGGKLNLFGFYGDSENQFTHKDSAEIEVEKDRFDIRYRAQNYSAGFNASQPVGQGSIHVAAALSRNMQDRNANLRAPEIDVGRLIRDVYDTDYNLLSTHVYYNLSINNAGWLTAGMLWNAYNDELTLIELKGCASCYFNVEEYDQLNLERQVWQPYLSYKTTIRNKLSLEAGIRYFSETASRSSSTEPRLKIVYPVGKNTLSFSYAKTGKVQPALYYVEEVNDGLRMSKAHHFSFEVSRVVSPSLVFRSELYYQHLYDISVNAFGAESAALSAINFLEEIPRFALVNEGKGRNYGWNGSLEKSFVGGSYFLFAGSLYESKYSDIQEVERDSRFNGNFTISGLYGKEWQRKPGKSTIGIHLRMLFLGGQRVAPVSVNASTEAFETTNDYSNGYPFRLDHYFRTDLRISSRKDKGKYTRTIALDIQNVFNSQNAAYQYYDFTQQKVDTQFQLGIIPVLSYRVDF